MRMFQYILGWVSIALVPVIVALLILAGATGDNSGGSIILKLVWTPFILIWGIKQIRKYRPEHTKENV